MTFLGPAAPAGGGGGSDSDVIWEWNGTDMSQFTESGTDDLAFSVDNSGPNGRPRILATAQPGTLNNGVLRVLTIAGLAAADFGDQYEIQAWIGPYVASGGGPASGVFSCLFTAWETAAQNCRLQFQNSQTQYQTIYQNSGADVTGTGPGIWPGIPYEKGLVRAQVSLRRSIPGAVFHRYWSTTSPAAGWVPATSWAPTLSVPKFAFGHYRSGGNVGDSGWLADLRIVRIP